MKIVFYSGHDREAWNPATLEAIGGSGPQVACARMAKELALLGHGVIVYGHLGNDHSHDFDGVKYIDSKHYFDPYCDVLVSSHRIDVFDHADKPKLRVMWLHDAHVYEGLRKERAEKVDFYFALSHWSKNYFVKTYRGYVDPEHVVITRSGLSLPLITEAVPRNPRRVVFTSRPERGLDTILSVWEDVVNQVDGAELVLTSYAGVPYGLLPNNVEIAGRVSPKQLAQILASSGVWAYPTRFFDTFCMAAADAMACGCVPVVPPIAALPETIRQDLPARWIRGRWGSDEYRKSLTEQLCLAMTETPQEERHDFIDYACFRFNWPDIAREWVEIFKDKLRNR